MHPCVLYVYALRAVYMLFFPGVVSATCLLVCMQGRM
jgi:hypothetical protein